MRLHPGLGSAVRGVRSATPEGYIGLGEGCGVRRARPVPRPSDRVRSGPGLEGLHWWVTMEGVQSQITCRARLKGASPSLQAHVAARHFLPGGRCVGSCQAGPARCRSGSRPAPCPSRPTGSEKLTTKPPIRAYNQPIWNNPLPSRFGTNPIPKLVGRFQSVKVPVGLRFHFGPAQRGTTPIKRPEVKVPLRSGFPVSVGPRQGPLRPA